jgi:hypothetical protein
MLDPVTEVIVRAWQVVRYRPQSLLVEEIASDKVERQATRPALQLREAVL